MAPPLLSLQNVALSLGNTPVLAGAELSVAAGERLCLVGRNGSGKSTLLKIAAGLLEADSGTVFVQPGATIRYLPQEPDFLGFATTLDYAAAGLDAEEGQHRAAALLSQLGLTGEEHPGRLSGGEARRAALARVLAPQPDILLLDEPTNHLDLPAIAWLEAELAAMASAMVLISHDRRMLQALGRAVVWLDRGQARRMDRGFAQFDAWRDEVLEQEERDRHKLARKIVMEEDWLRYGVTARRKRNQKRLGSLHALREQHRQAMGPPGAVRLAASEGGMSGKLVADADGISKTYPGAAGPVVRDLTLRVQRGDRLGIIGPNGAGKTTLLSLLTGKLAPDAGTIRLGASLKLESLDQRRDSLDPARTLADTLTGGRSDQVIVGGQPRHVIGYMKDFLFTPEQARTPVGVLSGGERGRLALAVALARPSNLLVLDEPTNDLDLETLELLQELLADYAGTVLLVSHDRDFLDRVATSVLAAEGNGRWVEYAGGYSDMVSQRGAPAPAAVVASSRPRLQATAPGPQPRKKLSFKDRHALNTLPALIAATQAEVEKHSAVLEDAELYARDPARYARAAEARARAEAALAEAEMRWLELELLREDVEGR
jgi:ATP-binding cassette subfamily F protein uup